MEKDQASPVVCDRMNNRSATVQSGGTPDVYGSYTGVVARLRPYFSLFFSCIRTGQKTWEQLYTYKISRIISRDVKFKIFLTLRLENPK